MARMFGTDGVRGVAGSELTIELATKQMCIRDSVSRAESVRRLCSLLRSRCASAAANRWMASGRNSAWTAESAGMRTARGKPCLCIREISGSPCTGLNMQTGANKMCIRDRRPPDVRRSA